MCCVCVRVVVRIFVCWILKMGRTNKVDLKEDEDLAEAVKKYPCIYDKADQGYREKDRVANAWRAIEDELGYEEGWYYICRFCKLQKVYQAVF